MKRPSAIALFFSIHLAWLILPPGTQAQNNLENSTFEGGLTGWTTTTPGSSTITVASGTAVTDYGAIPDGSKVAAMTFNPSLAASPTLNTTLSNLVVGGRYRVGCWVNTTSESLATATLLVLNNGTAIANRSLAISRVGAGNAYKRIDCSFTATATSHVLQLTALAITSAPVTFFFDLITIARMDVTNAFDSGSGSLRQGLAEAALSPGPDIIHFDAALSGQIIHLASSIVITDTDEVTVDASSLPDGITLDDGGRSGFSMVRLYLGTKSVTFRCMTFADGGGVGDGAPTSSLAGGAIESTALAATFERCAFTNNTAGKGGAIYHTLGKLTLTNCTFANNFGYTGGAIWCGGLTQVSAGSVKLVHCTLSQNVASTSGGIYADHTKVELENSIVADNFAGNDSESEDIGLNSSSTTLTYTGANLVGYVRNTGNATVNGFSRLQPNTNFSLYALASNGGPTKTMLPYGNSNNGVIDAAEGSTVTTDQRGFPRSRNGAGNGLGTSDIGAFEVQGNTTNVVVTTTADENDDHGTLGTGLSLREALRDMPEGQTLSFDPALSGQAITLTSAVDLLLSKSVTIDASALAFGITIDGGMGTNRIFTVGPERVVQLTGLTLTGGNGQGGGFIATIDGGAIANFGTLTLTNCTLRQNFSIRHGGAIYNEGTLKLVLCILGINSSAELGGGICNQGSLTLDQCSVSVCHAGTSGGGIYSNNTMTVTRSLFGGNDAALHGGAIEAQAGISALTNCTFTANHSASSFTIGSTVRGDGGAIHNGGTMTLLYATITGNRTGLASGQGGEGGGIALNGGSLSIDQSIVAENVSLSSPDIYLPASGGGTLTPGTDNLIGKNTTVQSVFPAGAFTGTTASPLTAKLAPLGNYGGPTLTMPPLPGSLALDASLALFPTTIIDQRGYPRGQDGDGNSYGEMDLGAVERSAASKFIISSTADSGAGSLRAILTAVPVEAAAPITFAASFSGTVTLSSEIVIPTGAPVVVDASSIPGGLTISGGGAVRIFSVSSGASLSLTGVTLTGGRFDQGGAISNLGSVALTRCTLSGNAAIQGGAIDNSGSLSLTQCTLSGNSGIAAGGAIANRATAVLTQCTLSGNSSDATTGSGGAIYISQGTLTLTDSVVAGNKASAGPDIRKSASNGVVTASGKNLIGSNETVEQTFPTGALVGTTATPVDAKLSALGSYGGPTQTMLPLPGSPAINPAGGATSSTFTTDQRGSARVYGTVVDLGAVEVGAMVTSLASSGAGTLRQAVLDAPSGMIINFDPSLSAQTITLLPADGGITLNKNVEINATGLLVGITVNGGSQNFRLFTVTPGKTVSMNNVKLTNGGGSSFTSFGGAITNDGILSLTRCEFSGNIVGSGQSGGAISSNGAGSSLTLTECTLRNNAADFGGAIVSANSSTTTLHRCTLNNNTARNGSGGALSITAATGILNQCTVAANTSAATSQSQSLGGGVYMYQGNLTLNACTIAGNSISAAGRQAYGGGVFYDGSLSIANTIISGNTVTGTTTGGPDMYDNHDVNFAWTGRLFIGNVSGSGFTTGASVLSGNAMLSALGSYGGPTQTMLPQAGSPVIDAATNTVNYPSAMSSFPTDQRGAQRLLDGDGNGTLLSDLGAAEYAPVRNLIVSNTADSGAGSLRQAIVDAGFSGGQDTISLSAGLDGKVIMLTSEIVLPAKSVTLDASALPNGLSIGGSSGDRLFTVPSGGSLTLRALSLTQGSGGGATASGYGGTLYNNGLLVLEYCTFFNNICAQSGGAIANENGTLTALQCTFCNNLSFGNGGALASLSGGSATLTHCTVSGNLTLAIGSQGGGLYRSAGTLTLTNCIVANNNIRGSGTDNISGSINTTGANFVPAGTGGIFTGTTPISTGVAAVQEAAKNGGPTPTRATLLGSVAINGAAVLSPAITRDQRGSPIVGAPDLGAYELGYSTTQTVTTLTDENDAVGTPGAGFSLREALRDAPAGAAITITFDPALSGGTVLSTGEISVSKNLTVDASSLPAGITLAGNNTGRLLSVTSAGSLTLRALTLKNGSIKDDGGAIRNGGALVLERCTFTGNIAIGASASGGAIFNSNATASLIARQCTFAGNSCGSTSNGGGAVANVSNATATFIQCTIASNQASGSTGKGGGVFRSGGTVTLTNCLVSGNTAGDTTTNNLSGSITTTGANFVPASTGGTFTGPAPVSSGVLALQPLASNGGPTQTMALLLGSAAVDGSVSSTFTSDQRGQAVSGTHDLGAYDLIYSSVPVTTLADENDAIGTPGTGLSLREALRDAPPGATINFAPSFNGSTVTLTSGEIVLTKNVTLDATALPAGVTVSGNNNSRIFTVSSGRSLVVRGMTFTRGNGAGATGNNNGGAILNNGGTLTAERCTFTANSNANAGAGVHNEGGTLTLTQCTFNNNTAPGGGGAVSTFIGVQTTLTHCTLSGNSGSYGGGGIYNYNGPVKLTNCIVAGNTSSSGSGADVRNEGTSAIFTRTGQNIVQNHVNVSGSDSGPVISAPPLLGTLASNGGATQTMLTLTGSPAIDAGSVLSPAITTDQRGYPIVGTPDLGAVEFIPPDYLVVSATADDGPGSLRVAFAHAALMPGASTVTLTTSGPITLASQIEVNDPGGVTLDATGMTNGATVQGGGTDGDHRLFSVAAGSSLTLRRVTLSQGGGSNFTGPGGAITCFGSLTLTQCTVYNNAAPKGAGGGVWLNAGGSLTATDSTFASNIAVGGGALNIFTGCTATLTRCTLSGNSAVTFVNGGVYASALGGAILNSGTLTLTHCTVADNLAFPVNGIGGHAGGIYNAGTLNLVNSLVAANNGNPATGADIGNLTPVSGGSGPITISSTGLNLVQTPITGDYTSAGTGTIAMAAPHLFPLGSYGGPTMTMPPTAGSPAINSAVGFLTTYDQRGCPMMDKADIGAVEACIINPSPLETKDATSRMPVLGWGGPAGASFKVYVGTTSGALSLDGVPSPATASSYTSTIPRTRGTTYLWRVDATVGGVTFQGPEYTFTPVAPVVTNGATSGTGSLRQAFADAASAEYPGADTITFAPGFSGTVSLSSEITVSDTAGVTLDGSSSSTPVILDGVTNTNRLLYVNTGTLITLKNLTFTRGGGVATTENGNGGGVINFGTLSAIGCTFTKNTTANFGGAFANGTAGTATLTSCTFYDNRQTSDTGAGGGAINNANSATKMTLIHCTISGNSAAGTLGGGAIRNRIIASPGFYVANCIIAGNVITKAGATGPDIASTTNMNAVGVNLISTPVGSTGTVDTSNGSIITADPQLAPFGSYGGSTQTMALLPSSPARNAAPLLSPAITADQRGFPLVGAPDIGAYENGTAGSFASFIVEATGTTPNATADTDHDGNPDLLEYATRGNTDVFNGNPVDKPQPVTQSGGISSVEFGFAYRPEARDLRYIVSRSGDLTHWTEIYRLDMRTLQITRASGVASLENTNPGTIQVNDAAFIPGHTFYKLTVDLP